jgi:hypothetical protein
MPLNISSPAQKSNPPQDNCSSNVRRFVKRQLNLNDFIASGRLRDAYLEWKAKANPATGVSIVGVRDMAERQGVDYSTAFRQKTALVKLGVMKCTPRWKESTAPGCRRSRLTNEYTFPILDENFLLGSCRGGTGKIARVKQELDLKTNNYTTAPEARICENQPARTEPERPRPDPEVWRAEQQARELRQARAVRQAASRQRRYTEAKAAPRLEGRSRRHHAPLTPVQQAAGEVLRLVGMDEGCWRYRQAIARAMERSGGDLSRMVEPMALAWAEYQCDREILFCPLGMERFFDENLWCNRSEWRYDRESLAAIRRNTHARIGMS